MATGTVKRGRPKGAKTHDTVAAHAFGRAVREARLARGLSQEGLAHQAGVERSHMGKIERGEHMPTLALIFKLAAAMQCDAWELVLAAEAQIEEPSIRTGHLRA